MDPILAAALGIAGMFGLILLHVPIGLSMAAAGVVGYGLMTSFNASFSLLSSETVSNLSSLDIAVVPLFILMGNFASAGGISADMYNLAHALLGRYNGGLAMATVGGCGLFGAVCGSSYATTATFGRVALPEMLKRGYAPTLATGCIAAGGNLGSIVPPSIILVVYAILAEQYIIELFIAALIPAALTILLYILTITIQVRVCPGIGPAGEKVRRSEILATAVRSWGAILLLLAIGGGIYGGVFTVTEAAALGAILAFLFAVFRRRMTMNTFWQTLADTATTSAMIYVVIIGASVLNYFIVVTHMPDLLATTIMGSGWPTVLVFVVLLLAYLVLGSIFDTIAAMVITLPFVLPVIVGMGYSPVWWGIINLIVVEVGLITPPIGMNVFVLHSVATHYPLSTIFRGILPFLYADVVRLTLLLVFPVLSLWLPRVMK
ncbi:MAG: TRAP transporter large permease [Deltaproteobacteria bacterium]|nr:TRAP transporter large permease [Deltaproteobacteria bacterium]